MGEQAAVYERSRTSELAAEQVCKLTEHREVCFGLDGSAAADENMRLIDGRSRCAALFNAQQLNALIGFDLDRLIYHAARAGSVGLGGSEGVRMDCDHLGTALGDDDVREDLSAVAGGGLAEVAVLVKAEVYRIRGEPGFEGDHHARRKIAPLSGRAVNEHRGVVFIHELGQRLLVRSCAVFCEHRIFRNNDPVRAAGDKLI